MAYHKKINRFVFFVQIISVLIIFVSLYYCYQWYMDNKKTDKVMENILQNSDISYEEVTLEDGSTTDVMNIDFDTMSSINSDSIGWIRVPETNINYPVVQTSNNDYYLTHSFDKSYNKSGWIFADYTNSNLKNDQLSINTVIYGHNRENNSMFGTLSNTLKKEWQSKKSNHYISFSTLHESNIWQVFSTYNIENENYYITTDFSSENEYNEFLNTIQNRSNYNFNVNLSPTDKILTLSTCTNIQDGRTVLHAKLIK